MPELLPKQALKDELLRLLGADLETLERAHREANAGATHEEAKPENDKDTRALEQSYLARGQARRVAELRTAILEVEAMALRAFGEAQPIALGALVSVEEAGQGSLLFLAPHGGGSALSNGSVQVVTPKSPLGRVLLGKCAGDECELVLPGKTRELCVIAVS
ncbi:MAG TPA: GreA/GreB family elongation factor [Polyangiaceae bacterium]|nr:GreA/GreB family elongation factor [Polyangiaceae bacterium]